jgi:hypothetical protein
MSAQLRAGAAKSDLAVGLRAGIPGLLALVLAAVVLSGGHPPFASDDRGAFMILLGLGWVGCTAGAGPAFLDLGWRHPIVLAGIALGIAALAIALCVVVGGASDRAGFVALEVVLLSKWVLGLLRFGVR